MAEKKKRIAGAIKNPGSLKRAAERAGRSPSQEEGVESKSKDPKIRARANLGARFTKHEI